jgi:hypothetical protein
MGALNPQLRCNNCGARLRGGAVGACPTCHRDLAEIGAWSELQDWGKTRQVGFVRYVWLRWVLGWGGLLALGMSLGLFLRGATPWPVYVWVVSSSLVAGFCLGWWYWQAAEREYHAAGEEDRSRRST